MDSVEADLLLLSTVLHGDDERTLLKILDGLKNLGMQLTEKLRTVSPDEVALEVVYPLTSIDEGVSEQGVGNKTLFTRVFELFNCHNSRSVRDATVVLLASLPAAIGVMAHLAAYPQLQPLIQQVLSEVLPDPSARKARQQQLILQLCCNLVQCGCLLQPASLAWLAHKSVEVLRVCAASASELAVLALVLMLKLLSAKQEEAAAKLEAAGALKVVLAQGPALLASAPHSATKQLQLLTSLAVVSKATQEHVAQHELQHLMQHARAAEGPDALDLMSSFATLTFHQGALQLLRNRLLPLGLRQLRRAATPSVMRALAYTCDPMTSSNAPSSAAPLASLACEVGLLEELPRLLRRACSSEDPEVLLATTALVCSLRRCPEAKALFHSNGELRAMVPKLSERLSMQHLKGLVPSQYDEVLALHVTSEAGLQARLPAEAARSPSMALMAAMVMMDVFELHGMLGVAANGAAMLLSNSSDKGGGAGGSSSSSSSSSSTSKGGRAGGSSSGSKGGGAGGSSSSSITSKGGAAGGSSSGSSSITSTGGGAAGGSSSSKGGGADGSMDHSAPADGMAASNAQRASAQQAPSSSAAAAAQQRVGPAGDAGDAAGRVCANCGRTDAEKYKRCARCQAVRYCSKECQKAHWLAGHKAGCVAAGGA